MQYEDGASSYHSLNNDDNKNKRRFHFNWRAFLGYVSPILLLTLYIIFYYTAKKTFADPAHINSLIDSAYEEGKQDANPGSTDCDLLMPHYQKECHFIGNVNFHVFLQLIWIGASFLTSILGIFHDLAKVLPQGEYTNKIWRFLPLFIASAVLIFGIIGDVWLFTSIYNRSKNIGAIEEFCNLSRCSSIPDTNGDESAHLIYKYVLSLLIVSGTSFISFLTASLFINTLREHDISEILCAKRVTIVDEEKSIINSF